MDKKMQMYIIFLIILSLRYVNIVVPNFQKRYHVIDQER